MRRSLDDLKRPLRTIELVTTDVFDTLLLRRPQSQRSRVVSCERQFARYLQSQGSPVPAEELIRARLLAERFAYRALNMGASRGEVRLVDLIDRQLALLGLSRSLIDRRLAIEIAAEERALSANGGLAMLLRIQRQAGLRVVAVSDTGLPGDKLRGLINHFHGPGLLNEVYSSADMQASKRRGDLFCQVLAAEGVDPAKVLHIGDDLLADFIVPDAMGIHTVYVPRKPLKRLLSQAEGATTEVMRWSGRLVRRRHAIPAIDDRISFGERVFGPIVAELCLCLWLYCEQARCNGDATLMFCARGGLGMREAFERFLVALGLPLQMKRENLLISRLIAARSAVNARSPVVLDELGREFQGASFAAVAHALGGKAYALPADWNRVFEAHRFFAMLETDAGRRVDHDIRLQNELFKTHLEQIAEGAKRIILCDTGLYGSTQRLLSGGLPERTFETVQFARCNYKGLGEDHFPKVAGLLVEDRFYTPFKVRTVVLRYWHIIESLFEPAIPSVRQLSMGDDGLVVGNSGDIRFGMLDPAIGNPLLAGALQYLDRLANSAQILPDADQAWYRLKQAITNPCKADVVALGVGPRSVDFGRSGVVPTVARAKRAGIVSKLASVRSQLWREGAIAQEFPRLKPALLGAIEMAHVVRGVSARFNR